VNWADLARRRDFRRLWLGDAVSLLGDWFTYVAVGMLALEAGEGLTAVALVLVAHTLPRALFSPLAGRLADRYDRRRIMVVVCLMRAAVVVGMALAAYLDAFVIVQVLLFIRMALGAFIDPAAQASLPQLLPTALLARANALLGATWSVVFAVGVGLGGLVTSAVGVVGALTIDAVTFGIAAAVLSTLPRLLPGQSPLPDVGPRPRANPGRGAEDQGEREDQRDRRLDAEAADAPGTGAPSPVDRGRLRDAWRIARGRPWVLEAALAKVPLMLISGGGWILLHGVAGSLGEVALALGVLHSVRGIGTGIGPLIWARSPRLANERLGLVVSTWLTATAVALFAWVDAPAWILVTVLLWGFGTGAGWVSSATRIQTLTPGPILGRISSLDSLGASLGQCVTGLAGGLLADATGVDEHAAWLGIIVGMAAWAVLTLLVGRPSRGEPA